MKIPIAIPRFIQKLSLTCLIFVLNTGCPGKDCFKSSESNSNSNPDLRSQSPEKEEQKGNNGDQQELLETTAETETMTERPPCNNLEGHEEESKSGENEQEIDQDKPGKDNGKNSIPDIVVTDTDSKEVNSGTGTGGNNDIRPRGLSDTSELVNKNLGRPTKQHKRSSSSPNLGDKHTYKSNPKLQPDLLVNNPDEYSPSIPLVDPREIPSKESGSNHGGGDGGSPLPLPLGNNSDNQINLHKSFCTLNGLLQSQGFLSVYSTRQCDTLIGDVRNVIQGSNMDVTGFNEWMKKADVVVKDALNANNKHQRKFQAMVMVAIAVIKVAEEVQQGIQTANGAVEKVKQAAEKVNQAAGCAKNKMSDNPNKVENVAKKMVGKTGEDEKDVGEAVKKAGKNMEQVQEAMKEVAEAMGQV